MILPIADETMTKATSKSLINRNRRAIPKITPSTSSMMMLFMENKAPKTKPKYNPQKKIATRRRTFLKIKYETKMVQNTMKKVIR